MGKKLNELSILAARGLLTEAERTELNSLLKKKENRQQFEEIQFWGKLISARDFLAKRSEDMLLSWPEDKPTRYWADWWLKSAKGKSEFSFLINDKLEPAEQYQGHKINASLYGKYLLSGQIIQADNCTAKSIIEAFREDRMLEGLVLTASWGGMLRGAPKSIYKEPNEKIDEVLREAKETISLEYNITSAWKLIETELRWTPVMISKCLHFIARSAGFEENPPVPFDHGVIESKVWPSLRKPTEDQEDPMRILRVWRDKENPLAGYYRYMTLIGRWASLRGWSTTQMESTLFEQFRSEKALPFTPKQGQEKTLGAKNIQKGEAVSISPKAEYDRSLPFYILVYLPPDTDPEIVKAVNKGIARVGKVLSANEDAFEWAKVSIVVIKANGVEMTPLSRPDELQPPVFKSGRSSQVKRAEAMFKESIEKDVVRTTENQWGDYKPLLFSFLGGQPDEDLCKLTRDLFGKQSVPIGLGPDIDGESLKQCTQGNAVRLKKVSAEAVMAMVHWALETMCRTSRLASMRSEVSKAIGEEELPLDFAGIPEEAELVA